MKRAGFRIPPHDKNPNRSVDRWRNPSSPQRLLQLVPDGMRGGRDRLEASGIRPGIEKKP